MKKNTSSVTTTKTSTVLYDSNGKIISQVRVKETVVIMKDNSPKPDLFRAILDSFIMEKRDLKKPVRRDVVHPFEGLIKGMEDREMSDAFPFMFHGIPIVRKPEETK